jgi:hypothetical protein
MIDGCVYCRVRANGRVHTGAERWRVLMWDEEDDMRRKPTNGYRLTLILSCEWSRQEPLKKRN